MSVLITLDEYFNKIGKELFSDWSEETVYYYSERKKELKHLGKKARKTYSKAINRIWIDGKVKVSLRLEQGYIDPPFVIEQFYFAQSGCISKDGSYYRCKLEIEMENRGRPQAYDVDDIIREYAVTNHMQKNVPLSDIKGIAVISYVKEFLKTQSMNIPHDNTIRNRLRTLYPECTKASRNSKK